MKVELRKRYKGQTWKATLEKDGYEEHFADKSRMFYVKKAGVVEIKGLIWKDCSIQ